MATRTRIRKSGPAKKRLIGKPGGQIQQRVQAVGPERFGILAVDCAKRRSKSVSPLASNIYQDGDTEPSTLTETPIAAGRTLDTKFKKNYPE